MKNTVYNFNTIQTVDGKILRDFTSVYYGGLTELLSNYPEYFDFIDVGTNEKMENVSYDLYGSVDYADVILACNEENFLWCMPYGNEVVIQHSENIRDYIDRNTNFLQPLDAAVEFSSIFEEVDYNNSQKRKFRVPYPEKINAIISLIENYRRQNSEENWDLDTTRSY